MAKYYYSKEKQFYCLTDYINGQYVCDINCVCLPVKTDYNGFINATRKRELVDAEILQESSKEEFFNTLWIYKTK